MPAELAGSTEDEMTEDATWLDGNALGGLLQECQLREGACAGGRHGAAVHGPGGGSG
jgi:hypothetical protein